MAVVDGNVIIKKQKSKNKFAEFSHHTSPLSNQASLPPPESLVISSSRCGTGLSSSNSIHFPGINIENSSVEKPKSIQIT
jgi:hypothetical protein